MQSIRSYLANSTTTAANQLTATYLAVLGATPSAATITADQLLLTSGQSQAGIRIYLSGTGQAFLAPTLCMAC